MGNVVAAPGSCGELVQGTISGCNFLVTCPINFFSRIEVVLDKSGGSAGQKTQLAVEKTLKLFGENREFAAYCQSDIPCGKGMASSSADIAAACMSTALCLGKTITVAEIAKIALEIEPTDGIFFPGIVMLDHVSGTFSNCLGYPPSLQVVIFDMGGQVDTISFNKRSDLIALNQIKEDQVQLAVKLLKQGLAEQDCGLIGRAATISARANQAILYKPCLEALIEIGEKYGAVGINVAHSGTVMGILFDNTDLSDRKDCIQAVISQCPELNYLNTAKIISGGLFRV